MNWFELEGEVVGGEFGRVIDDIWKRHGEEDKVLALGPLDGRFLPNYINSNDIRPRTEPSPISRQVAGGIFEKKKRTKLNHFPIAQSR